MRTLVILREAPYNGIWFARELSRQDRVEVRVFLLANALSSPVGSRKAPTSYRNS